MISKIRNSVFIKILWGVIAVYLLNISVDTADSNPQYIPEDLTFNDQETIVEIVVEKILGYENAIDEYDDHDTEDHNKKNCFKISLVFYLAADSTSSQLVFGRRNQEHPDFDAYLLNGIQQRITPPPKV